MIHVEPEGYDGRCSLPGGGRGAMFEAVLLSKSAHLVVSVALGVLVLVGGKSEAKERLPCNSVFVRFEKNRWWKAT